MATMTPGPARYAASTGDAVRPAAVGLTVAYGVVALPLAFPLPASQRAVMVPTMLAGGLLSALVGWSTRFVRRELGDVVHWFLAALASVPTVTSLVSLVVLNVPFQVINLILTLVGATALIHVRRAALVVGVAVVLGWLFTGLLLAPAAITTDSCSAMAMACIVAVILHVSRQRTVERLEAAREQITAMAVTDDLTGLGNRRALMDRGPVVVERARRAGRDVALVYLDVDGLKRVNDSEGHAAGDRVISAVGAALTQVFRDADIVARSGGDEFAVLVAGCGPAEVDALVTRLRAALAAVGASASVGAAHLNPQAPDGDLESLLDAADRAMYRAKHARRVATR